MSLISIRKKMQDKITPEYVRASSIIPTLAYDEDSNVFLMDDNSIGVGFSCTPISYGDEKIQERVHGFLNQEFPKQTTLQFILFRSPDINNEMYSYLAIRDGYRNDPLLLGAVKEREAFLKKFTQERITAKTEKGIFDNGLVQDLKLFITCKVPIEKSNKPSEEEMNGINELRTKIETSLQVIGLRPRPLTAQTYVRTLSTMLNWGKDTGWYHEGAKWHQDRPICEQVFDFNTDIGVSKEGISLGDHCHVKVLSAKKLPDLFYFGDALTYVGDLSGGNSCIKENYMVVTNVFFPEPESARSDMERKRQFAVNQSQGPMTKFVPVLLDKKENFDLIYDSVTNGSKVCKISYSLIIFSPNKERANSAAMAARNIWREARFEIMEDKFVSLPMFINCLPFSTDRHAVRDLFRYKTMTTEHATVLVPIFGEWKGTGTFHLSLLSRNGQLMSLSLHDSNTNKNLVIAAESGSGKSFLTNDMIISYLSEGAQIWVIDAGKSYKNLCELLKGDFIQFDDESAVCLSPFELIENYEDEEDALVGIIGTMASQSGNLSELQISSLKQIMTALWDEKGKGLKVDDVAERCLQHDDKRINDVGTQLYAFTSKGSYGKYFAGKNNVEFKNQFTVLELDELQGRKHLRQVVLLQLIYQIQQEVFLGERNRKKIVIIDEAWDLLKEGEVSVFMEHAYRKFRKYGGSMAIATQSINDLYENPVGRAIAENSASMYLLGQTEESVESVKRSGRLSMPDGAFNLLKTVHTLAGVYSEIFVKSKGGMGVGRLIVSDFQKLLYSTDPKDISAIEQFTKRGMGVADAINSVMASRGQLRNN